jgi:hypothetical protein
MQVLSIPMILFALIALLLGACGDDGDPVPIVHSAMTDCDGGKYDPDSNLCWQDPPSATKMNGYVATGIHHPDYNSETENYCGDLPHGDWRPPTISELRSLFRTVTDAECYTMEWDMSWTSVPSGYCRVWDDCLSFSKCWERSECIPGCSDSQTHGFRCKPGCGADNGPGAEGCYWDAELSGECWCYFSASEVTNSDNATWVARFSGGYVDPEQKEIRDMCYVRCVRSGP